MLIYRRFNKEKEEMEKKLNLSSPTKNNPRKAHGTRCNCIPLYNQCPASPPAAVFPWKNFPPVVLLSMALCDLEHPFGQLGSVALAVSPPSRTGAVHLQHGLCKHSILCKHCQAAVTSVCFQHCFHHKTKPEHSSKYCEEN